jgi:hypothetical protein
MTDAAVFKGTIGALRTIGGRKVIAVTVEVPIEEQSTVAKIAEHGAWVAVARINAEEAPKPAQKEKRRWETLSVGEQAGIRCGEKAFWEFLTDYSTFSFAPGDANECAGYLRQHFGVDSRKDIPRDRWNALENEYQLWLRVSV